MKSILRGKKKKMSVQEDEKKSNQVFEINFCADKA
jgi:hypothetical protein